MPSDFVGRYTKYAHDEAAALDCLARKNSNYSKKTNSAVDSKGNTLTVLDIKKI